MTGQIRILDDVTANQIAAGEVVERPASVVKELVENSIDAGANRIKIELKDGGLKEISIFDNGKGMSREDAQIAFQRHATSKITSLEDLNNLSTLGFRGEALASIASVSQIELTTRQIDELTGTSVLIEGGHISNVEDIGTSSGTKIVVRHLFYNTPARKKHLKGQSTELSHISEIVQKLALGNPQIAIKLTHNGRVIIDSLGTGKISDAILSIYGLETLNQVKYIKGDNSLYSLEGYIGLPNLARNTRNHQNFFINGRYVKSKVLSSALEESFYTVLPSKRYPFAILYLTLNPAMVDVNVHPTKMEVRFSEEDSLRELILKSATEALREPKLIPDISSKPLIQTKLSNSMDDTPFTEIDIPKYEQEALPSTTISSPKHSVADKIKEEAEAFKAINKPSFEPKGCEQELKIIPKKVEITKLLPDLYAIGQLESSYILAQGEGGLYIIDQHAAHERILYEEFIEMNQEALIQELLIPINLELTYKESNLVIENILLFRDLGYIIEHFGGQTFILRGIPCGMESEAGRALFFEVLDSLIEKGSFKKSNIVEEYLILRACKCAIKANEYLPQPIIEELLLKLSNCQNPFTCPHGRPTIINLSRGELDKRFGRTN